MVRLYRPAAILCIQGRRKKKKVQSVSGLERESTSSRLLGTAEQKTLSDNRRNIKRISLSRSLHTNAAKSASRKAAFNPCKVITRLEIPS